MRTFFVFGSIALYIACAFVQPSEANLRGFAEKAEALDSSGIVSQVTNVFDSGNTQTLIDSVKNDANVSTLVDTATNARTALIPDSGTMLNALTRSLTATSGRVSSLSDLLETEQNAALRSQYERIQWAVQKSDPRLCKVLGESNLERTDAGNPTLGDLLAFCLAETMHDATRCTQIDGHTAPALLAACTEGLDQQS